MTQRLNICEISVGDQTFKMESGKSAAVSIPAIAHHVYEVNKEVWVDAVTGARGAGDREGLRRRRPRRQTLAKNADSNVAEIVEAKALLATNDLFAQRDRIT